MRKPTFSICHTTARANGWQDSYDAWRENAANVNNFEYILCVDKRWGFTESHNYRGLEVIWNTGRKCSVDGWNIAAAASTGDIIILNSDDVFPCKNWDTKLIHAYMNWEQQNPHRIQFVIETTSKTPADDRRLMVVQIMSRRLYQKWGYALYPAYESMYADNDFTEHARQENVIIDARDIVIEHRHPTVTNLPAWMQGNVDEQYCHENRREAYERGLEILIKRRMNRFSE